MMDVWTTGKCMVLDWANKSANMTCEAIIYVNQDVVLEQRGTWKHWLTSSDKLEGYTKTVKGAATAVAPSRNC